MIGLVVVAHGRLASEMVKAVEHVVGPQPHVVTVNIMSDDDIEQCRDRLIQAVKQCDQGQGVIILTDMFGGTPSNLAISLLGQANIEVLAGFNLPMLVKLCQIRVSSPLKDATLEAQEGGRKYIHVASHLLEKEIQQNTKKKVGTVQVAVDHP